MLKKDYWQHHYHQAVSALQEARYNAVIESCNEAIKLNPNHPNIYAVYTKKAKALNKIYSYNLAIEAANKAIAINPKYEDEELASVLEEVLILNPHTPLKGLLNSLRKDRGKWSY